MSREIDSAELYAALNVWRGYKGDLQQQRNLQQAGYAVPNTKMSEFRDLMDSCSERMMTALDIRDEDTLESLGEIILNAAATLRRHRKEKESGHQSQG